MELQQNEQLIWRGHPSARAYLLWYLQWGLLAFVPVILVSIMRSADKGIGMAYWKWWVLSLVLFALVVIFDVLRRAAIDYVVTDQRIRIRRGILSRREQSTVIEKVQNINTNQSLLDRMLRVGSIDFDTAGTEANEASFRFDGVARPHALVARLEAHRVGQQRARQTPPI